MLWKVAIVFLLAMVLIGMIGRAVYTRAATKFRTPPVCPRCGRYLTGRGECACGRKG